MRTVSRPTLLFIVHSWGGGTIRYARELAELVAPQAKVVFAWGVENRTFYISERDPEQPDQSFDLAKGLGQPVQALSGLGVCRADVICTIGFQNYIDELLERLAIPFDATLLDYHHFSVAPHFEDSSGHFIGDAMVSVLAAAMRKSNVLPPVLRRAERRIACSGDLALRASQFIPEFPILPVRFPEREDPDRIVPVVEPLVEGEPMRVLVLGRIAPQKGLDIVRDVAAMLKAKGLPIQIVCLGEFSVSPDVLPVSFHVKFLGKFNQSELQPIVRRLRPHVAWLPFTIPETHSFALSDVMRLRLPVLATGIGAVPERVQGRAATWLVPLEQGIAAHFVRWLERLYADRLESPPHWLPIGHLPPRSQQFYQRNYLNPAA